MGNAVDAGLPGRATTASNGVRKLHGYAFIGKVFGIHPSYNSIAWVTEGGCLRGPKTDFGRERGYKWIIMARRQGYSTYHAVVDFPDELEMYVVVLEPTIGKPGWKFLDGSKNGPKTL